MKKFEQGRFWVCPCCHYEHDTDDSGIKRKDKRRKAYDAEVRKPLGDALKFYADGFRPDLAECAKYDAWTEHTQFDCGKKAADALAKSRLPVQTREA